MSMRPDALGYLLNMANIHAHQNALVVDDIMGLVHMAVAERMGGFSSLFSDLRLLTCRCK